jgi:hypothetical protein
MEEPFINVYLVLKTSISLMMEMPDTRKEIGFSGDISIPWGKRQFPD